MKKIDRLSEQIHTKACLIERVVITVNFCQDIPHHLAHWGQVVSRQIKQVLCINLLNNHMVNTNLCLFHPNLFSKVLLQGAGQKIWFIFHHDQS